MNAANFTFWVEFGTLLSVLRGTAISVWDRDRCDATLQCLRRSILCHFALSDWGMEHPGDVKLLELSRAFYRLKAAGQIDSRAEITLTPERNLVQVNQPTMHCLRLEQSCLQVRVNNGHSDLWLWRREGDTLVNYDYTISKQVSRFS